MILHPDRLFPADPETRAVARRLYERIHDLPIVLPRGHPTQIVARAKQEPAH